MFRFSAIIATVVALAGTSLAFAPALGTCKKKDFC